MGEPIERGVSHQEFVVFRDEMRVAIQNQTELMKEMVELHTKHNSLEKLVYRIDKRLDQVNERLLHIEQNQGGTNVKTQYNRDLIWLLLSLVIGFAGYAMRGHL
ncbi:hypothetical protein [Vibrio sp. ER1A]|uniref:hypothetical protein n=1 Tax=Vibrio sp. ER1A TaxID=1517681 RepID=UPI00068BC5EF|nr:hypothetical protein [Vibrio sp. ER1A]